MGSLSFTLIFVFCSVSIKGKTYVLTSLAVHENLVANDKITTCI